MIISVNPHHIKRCDKCGVEVYRLGVFSIGQRIVVVLSVEERIYEDSVEFLADSDKAHTCYAEQKLAMREFLEGARREEKSA